MQHGPHRAAWDGRGETESFVDARFQVIHLTEMLCCDLLSPRVEPVNFRSKSFKLPLVLEKVKEQRGENYSGSVGS